MKYLEIEPKIKSCQVYADIPYRFVDGKNLYVHLILPTTLKSTEERYPCILYVPGSGWGVQRLGREIPQLCRMAQKGYVVVCIQYRHAAWAPFPAQAIDVKYAIDFIFENADKYFVDTDRLILWGDSSGSHTALTAGYTKGDADFLEEGIKEHDIKCLIDYFGPVDLYKFEEDRKTDPSFTDADTDTSKELLCQLLRIEEPTFDNTRAVAVTSHVTGDTIPTLIMHGTEDPYVPHEQSELLYETLQKNGVTSELYLIKGAGHGEEPFWQEETLSIVDAFIKKFIK